MPDPDIQPKEADLEAANNLRITFQDGLGRDGASNDPDASHGRSRTRSLSRHRSRSRSSSRNRIQTTSPYSGVQIEYRTLSIQVTEAKQNDDTLEDAKDAKGLKNKDDEDYFAKLQYHELQVEQLCQQLNVSPGASDLKLIYLI
ncbi:hypothetical protein EDB81DRAFT_813667 [Dactylonectria macrodidyma]|uniref:Uncharacterized protein n=1 Tax=Dactylonectria macrodidyma TaxID=307937 RepID=A0A9P9IKZ7_9HYPO|nr:hypothetical protein EDB81DRAFT_813667 [Dactylonectria macrodidyma]